MTNRTDSFHEGKFAHVVDPKDGYSVKDCRNDCHRRLLEFLVPIVHPDKPTWVTITIGKTIFGALDGARLVDWGVVIQNLVQQLAQGVGKPKPTPICPFLFHLYNSQGLLTKEEETNYRTAKESAGYRITPEPESRARSEDDKHDHTLAPSPTRTPSPVAQPSEEREQPQRRNKRIKTTQRASQGSSPVRSRGEVSQL